MCLPRGKLLCEKLFFCWKKVDFVNKIGPKIGFSSLKLVQKSILRQISNPKPIFGLIVTPIIDF